MNSKYIYNNFAPVNFLGGHLKYPPPDFSLTILSILFIALLADQSSSTGLRVKVFERDSYLGQEFPGGFHYHKRREFMRTVIEGKRSPYIFHMSWTENKNNKQKFYQQLGDWFVNDQ